MPHIFGNAWARVAFQWLKMTMIDICNGDMEISMIIMTPKMITMMMMNRGFMNDLVANGNKNGSSWS